MNVFQATSTNVFLNKVFGASVILVVLLASVFLNPENVNLLPCYFREITGHSCPTCGLSHSFFAMSHFQLSKSFKFHPMGPILYVITILLFFKFSIELVMKKDIKIKLNSVVTRTFLGLFFCVWVVHWIFKLMFE